MDLTGLHLPATDHVYAPREDSYLLGSAARVDPGERVLELGCGAGLAALAAARSGARVTASDLNPFALRAVASAASAMALEVQCVRTDLFDGLGAFDVVLCNPPYLPSVPGEEDPDRWHELALNGGADGQEWLRRFLRALPDHLKLQGRAYVIFAQVRSPQVPPEFPRSILGESWDQEPIAHREVPGERLAVFELHRHRGEGVLPTPCSG